MNVFRKLWLKLFGRVVIVNGGSPTITGPVHQLFVNGGNVTIGEDQAFEDIRVVNGGSVDIRSNAPAFCIQDENGKVYKACDCIPRINKEQEKAE
jgi:hypothetical protein